MVRSLSFYVNFAEIPDGPQVRIHGAPRQIKANCILRRKCASYSHIHFNPAAPNAVSGDTSGIAFSSAAAAVISLYR